MGGGEQHRRRGWSIKGQVQMRVWQIQASYKEALRIWEAQQGRVVARGGLGRGKGQAWSGVGRGSVLCDCKAREPPLSHPALHGKGG